MAKKHDPFASLNPPQKRKSFLSSLLGRDKQQPSSTSTAASTTANGSSRGSAAIDENDVLASTDAAGTDYKSPFREEEPTAKKEKVSDSLKDNYTPPDLQKKSKTPKDFTSGTKLTQDLDKPQRRFSWRRFFRSSSPEKPATAASASTAPAAKSSTSGAAEPAIKEEEEATEAKDAAVSQSAQEFKDEEAKKAEAVNETEKKLVANEEPAAETKQPEVAKTSNDATTAISTASVDKETVSEPIATPDDKKTVSKPAEASTSTATTTTTRNEKALAASDVSDEKLKENRETPVVSGAVLGEGEATAPKDSAETEIIDLPSSKDAKAKSVGDTAKDTATESKQQQEVTKEVQTEPVNVSSSAADAKEPATTTEPLPEALDQKQKELNATATESLNKLKIDGGDNKNVDIGAGLSLKQKDLLKIAKERINPILNTLDSNAKKQQLTDEEYKEYQKQQRQIKHEAKLQKLKEKNETKYVKKESKYNTKIQDLKDKISTLEAKIKNAKEQHVKDLKESKKKHEETLKSEEERFKSGKEALIKEHEELKKKKEREIEELVSKQKKSKLEIKLLESQTAEHEAKSKLLNGDIADLEARLTDKKAALTELSTNYQEHQTKLDELSKRHEATTDKLAKEAAKQAKYDSVIKGESQLGEINAAKDSIKLYETQLATLKEESEKRKGIYKSLQENLEAQKKHEFNLTEARLQKEEEIARGPKKSKSSSTAVAETAGITSTVAADSSSSSASSVSSVETAPVASTTSAAVPVPAPAPSKPVKEANVAIPKSTITEPEPPKLAGEEDTFEDVLQKSGAVEIPPTELSSGAAAAKDQVTATSPKVAPVATSTTEDSKLTAAEHQKQTKDRQTEEAAKKTEVVEVSTAGGVGKVVEKIVDKDDVAATGAAQPTEKSSTDATDATGATAGATGQTVNKIVNTTIGSKEPETKEVIAGAIEPVATPEPAATEATKEADKSIANSDVNAIGANTTGGIGAVIDKIVDVSKTTALSATGAVTGATGAVTGATGAVTGATGATTEAKAANKQPKEEQAEEGAKKTEVVEESIAGGVGKVTDKIVDVNVLSSAPISAPSSEPASAPIATAAEPTTATTATPIATDTTTTETTATGSASSTPVSAAPAATSSSKKNKKKKNKKKKKN